MTADENRVSRSPKRWLGVEAIFFLLVLSVFVWFFYTLPPLSLYSDDEGAKYVQMKNFHLNRSLAIHYPGEKLGLDARYALNQELPFAPRGNRLFSMYPPLFPYLSSFFYPLLGDRVTHFLPLLSFFLSLLLLARILKRLSAGLFLYWGLLLTFLLGSPLLPYAFTFWEHLPAVFLVLAGTYFLIRYFQGRPSRAYLFWGALVLSTGIFFRTEIILLIAAHALSIAFHFSADRKWREIAASALGLALPLMAYAIFNGIHYRNPFGPHIVSNLIFFRFSVPKTMAAVGVVLGCLSLLFLPPGRRWAPAEREEIHSFLPFFLMAALLLVFDRSPLHALILKFPVLFLIFYGFGKRLTKGGDGDFALGNILLRTMILFMGFISYFFFLNPDRTVRFLLPIVPLAIVFFAAEGKRIFASPFPRLLLLAGLALSSAQSLSDTWKDIFFFKEYNRQRIEFLKAHSRSGDVVLFPHDALMQHAGPLFFERVYIVFGGSDKLPDIFLLLQERGRRGFFLWSLDPEYDRVLKPLLPKRTGKIVRHDWEALGLPPHSLFEISWEDAASPSPPPSLRGGRGKN